MVELYLHSPILIRGVVLHYLITYRDRFTFTVCVVKMQYFGIYAGGTNTYHFALKE
jgi:hypothetical protein